MRAVDRLRSTADAGLLVTNRPPGKNFVHYMLGLTDPPVIEHALRVEESDDQLLQAALERLITSLR